MAVSIANALDLKACLMRFHDWKPMINTHNKIHPDTRANLIDSCRNKYILVAVLWFKVSISNEKNY